MSADQRVPSLGPSSSGLGVNIIGGFRDQEPWGRWTLGKTAKVGVTSQEGGWAALNLDLELPYSQQALRIVLNGQEVGRLRSGQEHSSYTLSLALPLRPGQGDLQFLTDKSNRDPRLQPFAPRDPSDLGVAFRKLEVGPLQEFTALPGSTVYGTSWNPLLSTYHAVPGGEASVFSRAEGPQELTYRLLRTHSGQKFEVRLDGTVVRTLGPSPGGNLLVGRLPLTLDGQPHRLTIAAVPSQGAARPPGGSVSMLERVNGQVPFYIQSLSLGPPSPLSGGVELPLAGVAAALLLFAAYRWLLRPGRPAPVPAGEDRSP